CKGEPERWEKLRGFCALTMKCGCQPLKRRSVYPRNAGQAPTESIKLSNIGPTCVWTSISQVTSYGHMSNAGT
ncbi:hypothetical protein HAX54_053028, partial [Datura stramonium]|nr:hypothetical protein [Datura stramonium]